MKVQNTVDTGSLPENRAMKFMQCLTVGALVFGTTSCCDLKFAGMEKSSYASKYIDAICNDQDIKTILGTKSTNLHARVWADACGNVEIQLGTLTTAERSNVEDGTKRRERNIIDASGITTREIQIIAEVAARYAWIWDYRGTMHVYQVLDEKRVLVLKRSMRSLIPKSFSKDTHSFNPRNIEDHD